MAQLTKTVSKITPKKFYEFGYSGLNYKGKLTLLFSAERLQISAPRFPARWLYPLKPGGEQKSADVWRKTVTLIYLDPKKYYDHE